jgi:hypothetical protein
VINHCLNAKTAGKLSEKGNKDRKKPLPILERVHAFAYELLGDAEAQAKAMIPPLKKLTNGIIEIDNVVGNREAILEREKKLRERRERIRQRGLMVLDGKLTADGEQLRATLADIDESLAWEQNKAE